MAFTYDAKARVAPSTSNPVTTNFTCGASAKLLVVTLAYAYNASGRGGGAPTYNGVSLRQADQIRCIDGSPEAVTEIWYLIAPPTGSSYTVSVPNPNGLSVEFVVSSYNCAAGSTAVYLTSWGASRIDSSPSSSVTTTAIALIVAVVATGDNTFAPTGRTGTSLYETNNGNTWGAGHQYFIQTSAGTTTMSWTDSHVEDFGLCIAAFQEVTAARILTSKANAYAEVTPTKGVSAAKANLYAEVTTAKGISVAKANLYALVEGDTKVAQVAEEIVFTTDAPVQVAQAAEEIVFTTDAAPVQVAQVAQEIVLADYLQAQVAQVATEAMIQPTSQQAQVAQDAFEVMIQPTSQQAQVAQAAFEVMYLNETWGQIAQIATEVIIKAELGPQNADVAQVATEIIAQNPPRATIAHTATEIVLQNLSRANVAHTAVEIIAQNRNAGRVSHTAVELVTSMPQMGIVAHAAVEVIIKNADWVRTSHMAVEVPMPGPAGSPGDTMVTQMKLSVLQEGGGIVYGSQVTRGAVVHADEDLMVSHVVRATIVRKKRDFWPALIRMLGR